METKSLRPVLHILLLMLCFSVLLDAAPPQVQVKKEAARWVIEAVGTESAPPDLIHLMMKMEFESSLVAEATSKGEKQLSEFLAAVDRLQIPNLTYRVANNLITSASAGRGQFSGFVYTRNMIFTFAPPPPGSARAEVDDLVARLEDLGARYNSHCVTCIGSG
jgi:hypothetical protein